MKFMETEKSTAMNEPESESSITAELVGRVSQRVAMGIPLRLALAGEPVGCAEYEEHLRQHPKLAVLEDVAKLRFLENAMNILLNGQNAAGNFRWLIELVYSGLFAEAREEGAEPAPQKQTILGVPEEALEEARRKARAMDEEYWRALQEEAKKL